jgi:hypothetical protein
MPMTAFETTMCLYLNSNSTSIAKLFLLFLCNITLMKRYKATGLSLPVGLMKEIDKNRGDIPRSRYLLRMLENPYVCNECRKNSNQDSPDSGFATPQSGESDSPRGKGIPIWTKKY